MPWWQVQRNVLIHTHTHTHTTVLRPFFRDHPGEPVPEENFWTLWCKGRLTEADTHTIRLGATSSGLTSAHLHHHPFFTGRPTNSVSSVKSTIARYNTADKMPITITQNKHMQPTTVTVNYLQKQQCKIKNRKISNEKCRRNKLITKRKIKLHNAKLSCTMDKPLSSQSLKHLALPTAIWTWPAHTVDRVLWQIPACHNGPILSINKHQYYGKYF